MINKFLELNPNFSLESRIIEPCCGKGAFLLGLYKRGFKNIEFSDINPYNVSFCNLLLGTDKGKV